MTELLFLVEADLEGGYTARAVGESIFTQADSKEELVEQIRDAVRCHFEPERKPPEILWLHYVHDEVIAL